MKKLIGILMGCFFLIPIATQAQWDEQYFFPHINSLSFPTKDFGMAACENYYNHIDTSFTADSSAIILISDSGDTWNYSLVLPGVTFKDIQHVNTSTFYAVGYDTSRQFGVLAKTVDGGNSWDTTLMNTPLFRVSFPSDSVGYLLTNDTFIYKTIDSGKTWVEMTHHIIDSITPPTVSDKIHFVNDTVGFVVLWTKLFKTTDGGLSWSLKYNSSSGPPHDYISDIAFVKDDSTVYLIKEIWGNEIPIFKSTDLGDNWVAIDTIKNEMYFSVTASFPSKDTGYISGQFMMYKTVDGGNSWFRQYSSNGVFPNNDFNDWVEDLYCVDVNNCFAGGWGRFYRTFNGGDTILASSIDEKSTYFKHKLKLYPNPVGEQFYLDYSGQEQLQFQLYNLMGQKVEAAVQQAGSRYRFSVGHFLPKGVYLLRVNDGVGDEMLKIVKD